MLTVEQVRKDIPYLQHRIYLDCASVSPVPQCVIDELVKFYQEHPYNYGVGDCEEAILVGKKVEAARASVAKLIGAKPEEIVVSPKNTTEALNMVINGLPWEKGDDAIQFNIDHRSSFLPLLRVGKRYGVTVKMIKSNEEGISDPEEVAKLITDKTKLVSVSHVNNIHGALQNVKEICKIANEHGAYSLVDAAQSVGRMPVNVQDIGCTYMAFPGRKHMMGPQGSGVLYGALDALNTLEPMILGIRAANEIGYTDYELAKSPKRFETGIFDCASVIGMGRASEYLMEIGIDRIRRHIEELTALFLDGLNKTPGTRYFGPTDVKRQSGIIAFLPKMDPKKFSQKVDKELNMIVKATAPGSPGYKEFRDKNIPMINRASFHYYNTEEEIEKLLSAIKKG